MDSNLGSPPAVAGPTERPQLPIAVSMDGLNRTQPTLYVVVPCYNEEEVLGETTRRLAAKLDALAAEGFVSPQSRVVYVNDGSSDTTWNLISAIHAADSRFQGINLARNVGHQNALLAGLMTVKDQADCVISLDADLQDDINAIDSMLAEYRNGYDVVYGVRDNRDTDTAFKRGTASLFYRFMRSIGSESVPHHADYRLMSHAALNGLSQFREVGLYLRGMVPMVGYSSTQVYYKRGERFAGTSKYPFRKMVALAVDGFMSTNVRPLRIVAWIGTIVFVLAALFGIFFVIQWILGWTVPGWASIIVSIWALGGLQLLTLGIIGEYISSIFLEVKDRPRYIVREILGD